MTWPLELSTTDLRESGGTFESQGRPIHSSEDKNHLHGGVRVRQRVSREG